MKDELLQKTLEAKKSIVNGSFEIWNTRLELLRSIGDIKAIFNHLKSPVEPVADNGNCGGCNCGPESLGGEQVMSTAK
jgi:hypothetical protein